MSVPVSIVKGGNTEERVAKALSLIDVESNLKMSYVPPKFFNKPAKYIEGMQLTKDSRILIKPNFVVVPANSPYAYSKGAYELAPAGCGKMGEGALTTREAVRGVLKAFYDLGFKNLVVGEASGGCQTDLNYKHLGVYEIADEFDADIVDLNWEDSVKITIPNRAILDHIWVPRTVFEADLLVSVPAMKTYSLSLKNIGIGTLPGKYYGWNRGATFVHGLDKPIHDQLQFQRMGKENDQSIGLACEIVDVCTVNRSGLTIIDGTFVMDNNGNLHRPELIIAGFDPVATDAVAYTIMGFNPKRFIHMRMAEERGLGTADLSKIEIRGESIEAVKMKIATSKTSD
jgi:uncharacterized protein (DUF362 family)